MSLYNKAMPPATVHFPCTVAGGMTLYRQLTQMRVHGRPLPKLDGKPQRIDAERHDAQ